MRIRIVYFFKQNLTIVLYTNCTPLTKLYTIVRTQFSKTLPHITENLEKRCNTLFNSLTLFKICSNLTKLFFFKKKLHTIL